jgi:hypothetical protein
MVIQKGAYFFNFPAPIVFDLQCSIYIFIFLDAYAIVFQHETVLPIRFSHTISIYSV